MATGVVLQLPTRDSPHTYGSLQTDPDPNLDSQYLTVSPYEGREHLLDLRSVDVQYRFLAEALVYLEAAVDGYATTTYEKSLNWDFVFDRLREIVAAHGHRWSAMEFYVVEFRSKLQTDIDRELLFRLDKESHREATESGGLLKYWFGSPDSERRNLATCLWRSKQDAIKGGRGPWHRQARNIIPRMYESIDIKGLKLTIDDDLRNWAFSKFA